MCMFNNVLIISHKIVKIIIIIINKILKEHVFKTIHAVCFKTIQNLFPGMLTN